MLRKRLFLNLLPFMVVLVVTGFYAITRFSHLSTNVDKEMTGSSRSVVAAERMQLALAGMERELWATTNLVRTKEFEDQRTRFENSLAFQLNDNSLPREGLLNQRLATNYEALCHAITTLDTLRAVGNRRRVYEQEIMPLVLRIRLSLGNLLELNQKAIIATAQKGRETAQEVTRLMLVGLLLALALSAYACVQLSRSILKPIKALTAAIRELGQGNLDHPVPVLSQDELGQLAIAFNSMAAQLHEYRQNTSEQLIRLNRTMETTLASFPDPIFVLNHAGLIELRNPAAEELASDLQLNGELPAPLQTLAARTLESGKHFLPASFDEVVCFRVGGSEKSFLPRILTMRNKEDALFGVAVVLYDVTRFRLLDSAKTDLVATVSHELKSPLTSVRMVLHILLERTIGTLTPKQQEFLEAAHKDTERLLRILNDLLDLARLEEGNAELRRESIAPAELMEELMTEMADLASARHLHVRCVLASDLPPIYVDRRRMSYALANLLRNAIRFSPERGEILLQASSTVEGDVELSVADHGPGIDPEYQTRIFDRFFRAPGQTKTGAGLGLSIAREIVVAHGGRIGVKSQPGHGARFFIVVNVGPLLR